MGKSTLGLSDIIDKIKNEFVQLEKKSDKKGKLQFVFKDIEVEIAFVVSKKGKAGVNLLVAQLGGEYQNEQVHKIKFRIKPYKVDYYKLGKKPKWEKQSGYDKWLEDNEYHKPKKSTFRIKRRVRSAKRRSARR